MMFTGVPNMAWVFGYFRGSWTLRADLVTDFVCRLLKHMKEKSARKVTSSLRPEDKDLPDQCPMSRERGPPVDRVYAALNPSALRKIVELGGVVDEHCPSLIDLEAVEINQMDCHGGALKRKLEENH
jgi:hypothetical protein